MKRTVSTCAVALAFVSLACGSDTGPASDIAQIRVMHVRAGAPAIDLVVEGSTVVEDLEFSRTSAFVDVPAGDAALEIREASEHGVLDARTYELLGGERYTLLYGSSGDARTITLAADTDRKSVV